MSWFSDLIDSMSPAPALDAATADLIERAVGVIDPRLRALPHYQQRLRPAAEIARQQVDAILAKLPEAVPLNRDGWQHSAALNRMLATPEDIEPLLKRSNEMVDFAQSSSGLCASACHGLLIAAYHDRQRLGVEEQDGITRSDVAQTVMSFAEQRIVAPTPDMHALKQELRRRSYNQLFQIALERITQLQQHQQHLEAEAQMLKTRLNLLQRQQGGLEDLGLSQQSNIPTGLSAQLAANAEALLEARSRLDSLDDYLEIIIDILQQAATHLHIHVLERRLSPMNILLEDEDTAAGEAIRFIEVHIERSTPRHFIALPVRCSAEHLLPPFCRLDGAEHLL